VDDAPTDDTIFYSQLLLKISIEPEATVLELKQRIIMKHKELFPEKDLTLE